jgi:hypothetical protein
MRLRDLNVAERKALADSLLDLQAVKQGKSGTRSAGHLCVRMPGTSLMIRPCDNRGIEG